VAQETTGRRTLLAALLAGCAPTPQQQEMALRPAAPVEQLRALDSRRFDTTNQQLMLTAIVGVLQDLGFTIEETQTSLGIVVGSRIAAGRVRAQVSLLPAGSQSVTVRATFQRMVPRPGAMLPVGERISDAEVYRGFFDKLSQSIFLTAHDI